MYITHAHNRVKRWLADFVTELQPLLDAVSELAAHDSKGAAQAAFLILRYPADDRGREGS